MKNRIKFLSIIICLQLLAKNVLSEPFVVLEYRNKNVQSLENSDNPFLNNQNFSKKHKVKKNETLSDIIFKNVRKKIYKNLKIKKTENIILNKRVNELTIDELLWIYNFI